MNINEYMRKMGYTPNCAHIPDHIIKGFEEEQRRQELENARDLKIIQMQKDIENQKISQEGMMLALFELVKIQNETNKIMQSQCDELKRQNELLCEQNISQAKELKKQNIKGWITYGITTLIAIASVIGTFIRA